MAHEPRERRRRWSTVSAYPWLWIILGVIGLLLLFFLVVLLLFEEDTAGPEAGSPSW